jgi:ABC-type proline/glycine betaine transport system ATPase subunit
MVSATAGRPIQGRFSPPAGQLRGTAGFRLLEEPDGTGKTTTIEVIEGDKTPDSGGETQRGLAPRKDGYELKERIGIALQEITLHLHLRMGELLRPSTGIP